MIEYNMFLKIRIRQREEEVGGRRSVEEVLRLCTYIRGKRGWGEINESGLAMQAFCRHSTSKRPRAGQGRGRYMAQDGMAWHGHGMGVRGWAVDQTAWTGPAAQEPLGRHNQSGQSART